MRYGRCTAVALLLAAVLAVPRSSTAEPTAPAAWAVFVEYDSYGGRYPDLPVGYVNSARMLTALLRRGWAADHTLLLRDAQDRTGLRRGVEWLAGHARAGDTALMYVAGEYQFFDRDLAWGATLPALWKRIPTAHRVLIVETCFAERLTAAAAGIPGMMLPAVGRDELDWWGLHSTDRLVQGASFTYYLARALDAQPAGEAPDFAGAFAVAVAGAQQYFRDVIAPTPGALASFHAKDSYPERLATFPNPHLTEDAGTASSVGQF